MRALPTVLALSLVVMITEGCRDSDISNPNPVPTLTEVMSVSSSHPMYPYLNQYSSENLIGVVQAEHIRYSILNGTIQVNSTLLYCSAVVIDPADVHKPGEWLNPTLNGALMTKVEPGYYSWAKSSFNPLQLNFNGQYNTFETDNGTMYEAIYDSVQFGATLNITSHSFNSNISKANGTTIQWTGCNTDFVYLTFIRDVSEMELVDSTESAGFILAQSNSGQCELQASRFSALEPGSYTLRVSQYEPKLITLSGGRRVYIVALSAHEIDLNLVE